MRKMKVLRLYFVVEKEENSADKHRFNHRVNKATKTLLSIRCDYWRTEV